MPAFKYKDLMITVGHIPRQCLCFGWSFQITYRPRVAAEDVIEEQLCSACCTPPKPFRYPGRPCI